MTDVVEDALVLWKGDQGQEATCPVQQFYRRRIPVLVRKTHRNFPPQKSVLVPIL